MKTREATSKVYFAAVEMAEMLREAGGEIITTDWIQILNDKEYEYNILFERRKKESKDD